jgi:hypothetical protein
MQRFWTNVCPKIPKLLLLFVLHACKMITPKGNLLHLEYRLILVPTGDVATLLPFAVCVVQYAAPELVVLTWYVYWDWVLWLEVRRETI